jgi:hypothetical protein
MSEQEYDENHPEVIRAKAEAKERVLRARAQLHPLAQAMYSFFDGLQGIGCLLIFAIIVVAFCAPGLAQLLNRARHTLARRRK